MRALRLNIPSIFAAATLAVGLILATANVALADATVDVKVRDSAGHPADGQVTLRAKAGSASFSCTTHAGTCQIANVPGGQYVATLQPAQGEAPAPRTVMIPPSGTAQLIISTGH